MSSVCVRPEGAFRQFDDLRFRRSIHLAGASGTRSRIDGLLEALFNKPFPRPFNRSDAHPEQFVDLVIRPTPCLRNSRR